MGWYGPSRILESQGEGVYTLEGAEGMERKTVLADNIARFRKSKGYTQEELAGKLNISSQAVSKWENSQSLPDICLLPVLAGILETDIDTLMGYIPGKKKVTPYEDRYRTQEYYWGRQPGHMCLELLKRFYPTRPLRVLEIGCGEGKDAVFLARNGYQVTAFDATDTGIEKAKRLADIHQVEVRFFRADLRDFRPEEEFDIIYSSGVFHHILPGIRDEIMGHYLSHTAPGGMHAVNVFVEKPFIPEPPDSDLCSENWKSGELFTYYGDWVIEECREEIFDCNSSGIPHKHCMDTVFARKPV